MAAVYAAVGLVGSFAQLHRVGVIASDSGLLRYETVLDRFEYCDGTDWWTCDVDGTVGHGVSFPRSEAIRYRSVFFS